MDRPGIRTELARFLRQFMAFSITFMLAAMLATMLAAQPVLAGDSALAEPIGFSRDGSYFAFEEFGIADGTGLAYASLYVVDLNQNVWVVGTPVRAVAEDSKATIGQLRQQARQQALQVLTDLEIDRPAQLLAANGDGQPDIDRDLIRFGLPRPTPQAQTHQSVRGDFKLALSTFPTAASSPCKQWFGGPALGFRLTDVSAGGATELFSDDVLSRSRGCPVAYDISAIYAPFQATDASSAVALISVYQRGFEGLDRRFVAEPVGAMQKDQK